MGSEINGTQMSNIGGGPILPSGSKDPNKSQLIQADARAPSVPSKSIESKATAAPSKQPDKDSTLDHALADINGYVQSLHRELKFSHDKTTGQTVVQVVNQDTNEVVRQFPPEFVLKLAQVLQSAHSNLGSIFSGKA
jgi:flagellar protein FlaG